MIKLGPSVSTRVPVITSYLVIRPKEKLRCALIRILCTLVRSGLLSVSVFGLVIPLPVRYLGPVGYRAHISRAAFRMISQFKSLFSCLGHLQSHRGPRGSENAERPSYVGSGTGSQNRMKRTVYGSVSGVYMSARSIRRCAKE